MDENPYEPPEAETERPSALDSIDRALRILFRMLPSVVVLAIVVWIAYLVLVHVVAAGR